MRCGAGSRPRGRFLLVGLAYLVSLFPLPLPRAPAKGAWPCAHHHCGCSSAEDCRQACCCFGQGQGTRSGVGAAVTRSVGQGEPGSVDCHSDRDHVSRSLVWVMPQAHRYCKGAGGAVALAHLHILTLSPVPRFEPRPTGRIAVAPVRFERASATPDPRPPRSVV